MLRCSQAYRELVELARGNATRTLTFEIQMLALGDELCVVAMTHEVFAEYQFWIDDVSPFANSIVFAYTNGCESYIPCERDFAFCGYEAGAVPAACAALSYRNRLTFEPGVERQIKKAIGECFGSMNPM